MQIRTGTYHYQLRGNCYYIYKCISESEQGTLSVSTGEYFNRHELEKCRQRVYELNNWQWKSAKRT